MKLIGLKLMTDEIIDLLFQRSYIHTSLVMLKASCDGMWVQIYSLQYRHL